MAVWGAGVEWVSQRSGLSEPVSAIPNFPEALEQP